MTGYNRLNGTWCAEHEELLSLPRDEWGVEGFIVSHWGAVGSTDGSVHAGLDLEMPGPGAYYETHLLDAVKQGELAESDVDVLVSQLLHVLDTTGALDESATVERPEHRALAQGGRGGNGAAAQRRTAAQPNADAFAMMGGGSAAFHPNQVVSPIDAIRASSSTAPGTQGTAERAGRVRPRREPAHDRGGQLACPVGRPWAEHAPALLQTWFGGRR